MTVKKNKGDVEPLGGFTDVKKSLSGVSSHSAVQSSSDLLVLQLNDGRLVSGKYHRWDRDMNAHHVQAKKGDGYFVDGNGSVLSNVIGCKS